MDTWMGQVSEPITLNKYLYGNGDPVNFVDFSGKQGDLVSFNTAFAVMGILATTAITGPKFSFTSDSSSNVAAGSLVITSLIIADKQRSLFCSIFSNIFCSESADDDPPAREIDLPVPGNPEADSTGAPLSEDDAVDVIANGGDVIAKDKETARKIAQKAGGGKPPVHDEGHRGGKPHYHPNGRPGGHVFY